MGILSESFTNPPSSMSDIHFTENDGSFISQTEADELILKTRAFYKESGIKSTDYTHYQVFGKARLQQLLDQADSKCVAFKFHFVADEKLNNPRLVVMAVDENGNVLAGQVLAAGPKCPPWCIPPIPPDN